MWTRSMVKPQRYKGKGFTVMGLVDLTRPVDLALAEIELSDGWHSLIDSSFFFGNKRLLEGEEQEGYAERHDLKRVCLELEDSTARFAFITSKKEEGELFAAEWLDCPSSFDGVAEGLEERDKRIEEDILAWNVRGAANPEFRRVFQDMMPTYLPDMVLLTETRISGEHANNVIASLGFDNTFKVDAMGFAGGM
ncbi:reverse transcriptase [Senna tora]|uniref:Reverse transcriptase n=1 Tax=Senna tora TaxID=362788 RepID=A0A835CKZ6_9FABA|nr:reverse transcriptase [Senna tora]